MNAGQPTGTDAQHPGHSYGQGCDNGQMQIPTHIAVDTVFATHYIYVSDPRCRNVYIFDHQGGFHGQLDWTGSGVGTPIPRGVGEDAAGNIWVAEFNSRRIFVFDPTTKKIIGSIGPQSDENDVRGLDIDPVNHLIYTVGAYWNRTYEFSYDPAKVAAGTGASSIVGKFVNEWRNMDGTNFASGHQQMDSIRFPAVDGQGNVYVGETWGCDAWCTGTPVRLRRGEVRAGQHLRVPVVHRHQRPDHLCRCHQAAVGDRPAAAAAGRVQPAERHRHRSIRQLVVRGRHVRAARAEVRLHVHLHIGRPAARPGSCSGARGSRPARRRTGSAIRARSRSATAWSGSVTTTTP